MGHRINAKKYKAVFWDWNGTLLNDVDYSLACINNLLERRGMKTISKKKYKHVFTFPVKVYYEAIGFDFKKEAWAEVAMEYMTEYWRNMDNIKLYDEAISVLKANASMQMCQFLISAMENDKLNNMVRKRNLDHFFLVIKGIENHYAESKSHLAGDILEQYNLSSDEVVWIGDTFHDFEVASSLGIDTIFIAHGHQDAGILEKAGCIVLKDLSQLDLKAC